MDVVKLAGPLLVLLILVEQLGLAASVAVDSDKAVFWDHLIYVLCLVLIVVLYTVLDYHLYRSALGEKVGSAIEIDWPIFRRLFVAWLKLVGLFFLGVPGVVVVGFIAALIYLQGFDREVFDHAAEALNGTLLYIWFAILMMRLTFYFPDMAMGRVVKLRSAWRETWNLPVGLCMGLFAFYMIRWCLPTSLSQPFTDTDYQTRLWLLGKSIWEFAVYVLTIFMVSVLYQQWRTLHRAPVEV